MLGQLTGIAQVQLSFDLLAIILDGLDAQMEFLGNILGPLPSADELEDFQFAIA